ncbi:ABC transporter ATP-binding protein [Streptomyces sp. NPDC048277]|uniref:ABC transporter ATP-binding protein n=1 Tax=Streptomyces sp. NPDC048277 TaxID=3155027 RepID=UPI0033FC0696
MSEPTDAAQAGSDVPAPRAAPLPLPPAEAPADPQDGDVAEDLEETYWSVHDGASANATVYQVLARLPKITRLIGRLAWHADRTATTVVITCQLTSAAMSAFSLLASVAVLQHLFAQGPTPDRVRSAIPQILVVVGFLAARALLDTAVAVAQARITPKIRTALECEFLHLTAHVRLEAVEDSTWHDEVYRANDRGLFYARQIVGQVIALASAALALTGTAGVLSILHPALLPLLLLSVFPVGMAAVRSARARFHSFKRWNALQRRVRVFSWLLIDVDAAPELRVDTAQGALLDEHHRLTTKIAEEDTRLGVHAALINLAGRAVGGFGTGITYTVLGAMLIAGWLPLQAGAGAVLAIQAGQSALTRLVDVAHLVYEHALWVDDLLAVQDHSRKLLQRQTGQPAPHHVKTITARDVHFTYPGKTEPALNGISLTLHAGQTAAFVGLNGSGKSTLAKLLAGLYETGQGSVCWDGVDVREMDAASLHRQVACVLQEPVRFPFSALSNITIATGTLDRADPQRAMDAARASGADQVIAALPRQWQTLLSKRFKGGHQPSGGQWAKLAVGRGLYKKAPLLILDEPTASMDPPSEHAVYEAVLRGRLRDDQITIMISHRLASVVDCDQIHVFDQGRITESGTHDDLMAQGGTYAAMFTLQAAGYQPRTASEEVGT